MAEKSKIQWTGNTWNPWHGCKKVSEGCKFCYMYRDKERYGQDPTTVVRASYKTFTSPLKWTEPGLVFTCSWSDWFIEDADNWRDDAWDIIRRTPHLQYQILTKRPENILERLPADWGERGYENVWLGVSVENQQAADERIPKLYDVPARIRFLSIEPLLGPVDLSKYMMFCTKHKDESDRMKCLGVAHYGYEWRKPDWIIVGGESGNDVGRYRYRPCKLQWIRQIVRACEPLEVPVFVKQLGTYLAKEFQLEDRAGGAFYEFPADLQKREFPLHYTGE